MRAAVTGATGLIGRALLKHLDAPLVFSRSPERARATLGSTRVLGWDPPAGLAPPDALQALDAVFNLAGEPVAGARWTRERRQRIWDSRVVGTRNLVASLASLDARPEVLVSASAVGFYGDRGDEELDEGAGPGSDFLAEVCAGWEAEAKVAVDLGMRVVLVRIGIVLARGSGALAQMLTPFRLGVGGRLGSGRQWMSWVHIDDVVGLLLHAARAGGVTGPLNAVAPEPVRNADFTRALAAALHRPALLPVPALALRAVFGEFGGLLTASQRALPRAALAAGYAFAYPNLPAALAELLTEGPGSTLTGGRRELAK